MYTSFTLCIRRPSNLPEVTLLEEAPSTLLDKDGVDLDTMIRMHIHVALLRICIGNPVPAVITSVQGAWKAHFWTRHAHLA